MGAAYDPSRSGELRKATLFATVSVDSGTYVTGDMLVWLVVQQDGGIFYSQPRRVDRGDTVRLTLEADASQLSTSGIKAPDWSDQGKPLIFGIGVASAGYTYGRADEIALLLQNGKSEDVPFVQRLEDSTFMQPWQVLATSGATSSGIHASREVVNGDPRLGIQHLERRDGEIRSAHFPGGVALEGGFHKIHVDFRASQTLGQRDQGRMWFGASVQQNGRTYSSAPLSRGPRNNRVLEGGVFLLGESDLTLEGAQTTAIHPDFSDRAAPLHVGIWASTTSTINGLRGPGWIDDFRAWGVPVVATVHSVQRGGEWTSTYRFPGSTRIASAHGYSILIPSGSPANGGVVQTKRDAWTRSRLVADPLLGAHGAFDVVAAVPTPPGVAAIDLRFPGLESPPEALSQALAYDDRFYPIVIGVVQAPAPGACVSMFAALAALGLLKLCRTRSRAYRFWPACIVALTCSPTPASAWSADDIDYSEVYQNNFATVDGLRLWATTRHVRRIDQNRFEYSFDVYALGNLSSSDLDRSDLTLAFDWGGPGSSALVTKELHFPPVGYDAYGNLSRKSRGPLKIVLDRRYFLNLTGISVQVIPRSTSVVLVDDQPQSEVGLVVESGDELLSVLVEKDATGAPVGVTGASSVTPDGEMTVWLDSMGRPAVAVVNDRVIGFSNYQGRRVDITVYGDDGGPEFSAAGVEIDLGYLTQSTSARLLGASTLAAPDLPTMLRIASLASKSAACAVLVLSPPTSLVAGAVLSANCYGYVADTINAFAPGTLPYPAGWNAFGWAQCVLLRDLQACAEGALDAAADNLNSARATASSVAAKSANPCALFSSGDYTPSADKPPQIFIASPPERSVLLGSATVTASVRDECPDVEVSFELAPVGSLGTIATSIDRSPPYLFAVNTTALANGEYVVYATAKDRVGHETTVAATYRVDNTALDLSGSWSVRVEYANCGPAVVARGTIAFNYIGSRYDALLTKSNNVGSYPDNPGQCLEFADGSSGPVTIPSPIPRLISRSIFSGQVVPALSDSQQVTAILSYTPDRIEFRTSGDSTFGSRTYRLTKIAPPGP